MIYHYCSLVAQSAEAERETKMREEQILRELEKKIAGELRSLLQEEKWAFRIDTF